MSKLDHADPGLTGTPTPTWQRVDRLDAWCRGYRRLMRGGLSSQVHLAGTTESQLPSGEFADLHVDDVEWLLSEIDHLNGLLSKARLTHCRECGGYGYIVTRPGVFSGPDPSPEESEPCESCPAAIWKGWVSEPVSVRGAASDGRTE